MTGRHPRDTLLLLVNAFVVCELARLLQLDAQNVFCTPLPVDILTAHCDAPSLAKTLDRVLSCSVCDCVLTGIYDVHVRRLRGVLNAVARLIARWQNLTV